jgi:NADPH-dependent 2,4-dienoyl-CoA reductase/sulfur reductase-like enzyme
VGKLVLKDPDWYAQRAVRVLLGRRATRLDAGAKVLVLEDGKLLPYDGLVIATGSEARGLGRVDEASPVSLLRTVDDCARLHHRLRPGQHLVLVGAGFIGLEVAATAREIGVDVSVVEVAPAPLSRVVGDEVGEWFRSYQAGHGVDFFCGAVIDRIEPRARGTTIALRDGTVLAADVVVAGVGVRPATDWLRGSGVVLADGVVCDKSLRTSAPDVVAAGDVTRWYNALFDEQMRVEQWTNAVEQGRHAALTLLGADDAYAPVPYFWSDQFDAKMRFVGRANAAQHVRVERSDERGLVVLFGRDGLIRGSLCVNAPRQLVGYRKAILDQMPWEDVVGSPV